MKLRFFGRGSGFADEHNSAYFVTNTNDLVIIDCPASTYHKLKHTDLQQYDKIYVLITHTHGDHSGGLGLFVQHTFFKQHKVINIVAPSRQVFDDLFLLLTRIEGCKTEWFKLVLYANVHEKWMGKSIRTIHSPQLCKKCFGYQLQIDNTNIVYTGDTSTLVPYIPCLHEGTELYVDVSVRNAVIHLELEKSLSDFILLTERGIQVYLMHLDDADTAELMIKDLPGIELVTVE